MKRLWVAGFVGVLGAGMAFGAWAQSATKEVATAHAHALMAQQASSLKMTHTHLHHVINCLVGPNGQGYDAAAGTPCKGQGNGALPDSASNATLHGKLESALASAESGLKSNSLDAAHADAAKAAAALGSTSKQKSKGAYSW